MKRIAVLSIPIFAFLAMASPADAKKTPPKVKAGRTAISADSPAFALPSLVQATAALPEHATLGQMLTSSTPVDATLTQPGDFTFFAPDDGAFTRLAPGTVQTLLKPENAAVLAQVLKFHVLQGGMTLDDIKGKISQGGGTATLMTLDGQPLIATLVNDSVKLSDSYGNASYITMANTYASNGVVHVINGMLSPKF